MSPDSRHVGKSANAAADVAAQDLDELLDHSTRIAQGSCPPRNAE